MKRFEYQWRPVTRCSENSHIMPALEEFGTEGWEVFQVEATLNKKGEDIYAVWMRREIEADPAKAETE